MPLPAPVSEFERADLLICATSGAHHVWTLDHVRQAMAPSARQLTLVDLSVPRNVDAAVAALPGVRLIDLEGMPHDTATDPALAAALAAGSAFVTAAAQRYADALLAVCDLFGVPLSDLGPSELSASVPRRTP